MIWYPFYPGDYGRDTADLSLLEHGAYRLLLDVFYATEKPLPLDDARLYRMVRAGSEVERAAVDAVLERFWRRTKAGYVNGRAKREIHTAETLAAAKTERARKAARARWGGDGDDDA